MDAAVRQVIGGAVDASEVIDLFASAGLESARLDILSEDFLERVPALEPSRGERSTSADE